MKTIFKLDKAAFGSTEQVFKGNPVRAGNCPATVKGTKAIKSRLRSRQRESNLSLYLYLSLCHCPELVEGWEGRQVDGIPKKSKIFWGTVDALSQETLNTMGNDPSREEEVLWAGQQN